MAPKLNTKQKLALKKMEKLPTNKRGSVSGSKVINCLLEFGRASGNPLGKRIKECRTKHKLTQKQLAFGLGWTSEQMSRIERGYKAISVESCKRLAAKLDVTPEWLLTGKAPK